MIPFARLRSGLRFDAHILCQAPESFRLFTMMRLSQNLREFGLRPPLRRAEGTCISCQLSNHAIMLVARLNSLSTRSDSGTVVLIRSKSSGRPFAVAHWAFSFAVRCLLRGSLSATSSPLRSSWSLRLTAVVMSVVRRLIAAGMPSFSGLGIPCCAYRLTWSSTRCHSHCSAFGRLWRHCLPRLRTTTGHCFDHLSCGQVVCDRSACPGAAFSVDSLPNLLI